MSVHVISVSVSFELALLSCLFCHFKKMNCILNTSFLNATSLKYNFLLNSMKVVLLTKNNSMVVVCFLEVGDDL